MHAPHNNVPLRCTVAQWLMLRTGRLDPGRLSPGLKTFPSVAFFQGMVDLISGALSFVSYEINTNIM